MSWWRSVVWRGARGRRARLLLCLCRVGRLCETGKGTILEHEIWMRPSGGAEAGGSFAGGTIKRMQDFGDCLAVHTGDARHISHRYLISILQAKLDIDTSS